MKNLRHKKIIDLVENYDIYTQEELCARLKAEGFDATQATISRDIKSLNLYKKNAGYGRQKYAIEKKTAVSFDEKYLRVLRDGFISMDNAMNILVIKTVSGMAMAVAAAVDALQFHEVVGTIAGDDTVMMAVRTVEDTEVLMGKLSELLEK